MSVRLAVYNMLGQEIRVLVNGNKAAGQHRVLWDGRDAHGRAVSSGVFLYRLTAGENHATGRMLLVK